MPIKIPNALPAHDTLVSENIFVMTHTRAMTQDIRPLRIGLLNLMPTKITTETQLARLLGNTPLQVELDLVTLESHVSKNTPLDHMLSFYEPFSKIRDQNYDGFIITGAPVEQLPFEEVDYWDELCSVMEWTRTHVTSTLHICWGAQAGLYYHYGINKVPLEKKMFGVFAHHVTHKNSMLLRGFDDVFMVPHSRHTTVRSEDIAKNDALTVLAESDEAGVYAIKTDLGRQVFIMGHSEYDGDTLKKEYERDRAAGLPIEVPQHYFPNDDPTKEPIVSWRSCANLMYSNWLNYYVYQETPYDLGRIG